PNKVNLAGHAMVNFMDRLSKIQIGPKEFIYSDNKGKTKMIAPQQFMVAMAFNSSFYK
ncbi:MAG: hypothetical protein RJA90_1887, partial [Bacteroidota bacterium]